MTPEFKEAFESIDRYLSAMIQALPDLSQMYRMGGNAPERSGQTTDVIEGLTWLHEALRATASHHANDPMQLLEPYKELSEALANQDHLLIADLLEYEILPVLENWKRNLP